ncbi:hypothetical protein [Nocardia sp. NPDC050793]|uniref:hypothetical protein n=1 Tax=Nocardia sp. NPDC050793 TaxID=3155159 RepID=UPI0033EAB27A
MPTTSHRTRFLDHRIPSLYAGQYLISVEQNIDTVATLTTRQQHFGVRGPRFSLGGSEIHGCYPVPGAVGKYSQILPHITLDAAGLPWARLLGSSGDGVPWVALLLFREGELPEDPQAVGEVTVSTVRQLLDRAAGPGKPPTITDGSLMDGEAELACSSILVPANVFATIRPTVAELALLAHIREGGPPDADHVRGTDPEPQLSDLNATVVSSRFPAATAGRHVAHLVSLEGMHQYLTGTPPSEGLRLVTLHAWAFETLHDTGIGFGDLVQHLAAEPDLALRVPLASGSADGDAIERLRSGATAMAQRLESGERSVSFYRGPLTADPAQRLPAPAAPRLESAGEALIYLKQWGIFDTGYASAFSLGRTLALADAPFRDRLLEFRKVARRAARRIGAHPDLIAGRSVEAAGRAVLENQARHAFDQLLETRLSGALGRSGADLAAAPIRPAARATRGNGALTAAGLRATVAQAETRAVLRAAVAEELDPVQEWLNRLVALEMLPFEHLVPDPRMLPPESIRFFYVDEGWLRAAVDGALSVGVGHALDADLNTLALEVSATPACGVLIRSALVPNWPRTIYSAFRGEQQIAPSRQANFGNGVLLLLYPEVIDTFTIAEPPQGLYFGVGDVGTIQMRWLTGNIGSPIDDGEFPEPAGFGRFLRPSGDVLDIENKLLPELAAAHGMSTLSPAQFALQMIRAPQIQTFDRS